MFYLFGYNTNLMTNEANCADVRMVNNLMQYMEKDLDLHLETYEDLPAQLVPVAFEKYAKEVELVKQRLAAEAQDDSSSYFDEEVELDEMMS